MARTFFDPRYPQYAASPSANMDVEIDSPRGGCSNTVKTIGFVLLLGVAVAALVIAIMSSRKEKKDDSSLSDEISDLKAAIAKQQGGKAALASTGVSDTAAADAETRDYYDYQGRMDPSPMPSQPRRTTHRASHASATARVNPGRPRSDPTLTAPPELNLPNPGATQGLTEEQARMLSDPNFIRAKTEALWTSAHRKTTPRKDPAQFHGHADPRLLSADKKRKAAFVQELKSHPEKYEQIASARSTVQLDDLLERMH